jgi:flagellar biogenesis protein FliO
MKRSRSRTSKPVPAQVLAFPLIADEASLNTLRASTGLISRAWAWVQEHQAARSGTKRLRVADTVSLGEKRFVAVVDVDGRHFLLAGGPTNIVLLAQLDSKEPFETVLKKTMIPPGRRPAKRAKNRTVPAKAAKRGQPQATDTFADVLDRTTTTSAMQAAKQIRNLNGKNPIRQTGNA